MSWSQVTGDNAVDTEYDILLTAVHVVDTNYDVLVTVVHVVVTNYDIDVKPKRYTDDILTKSIQYISLCDMYTINIFIGPHCN